MLTVQYSRSETSTDEAILQSAATIGLFAFASKRILGRIPVGVVIVFFDIDELHEIQRQAVQAGLHNKRSLLMAGILPEYVAMLEISDRPSEQVLLDLQIMNDPEPIVGGVVPLERWLRNAAFATSMFPTRQKFFRERADRVEKNKLEQADPTPPATVAERVLFDSELLPVGFLAGALRTSAAVARLTVNRFEDGEVRKQPYSDEQMQYFGTAWLIGPKHLITNYHVVDARSEGEERAAKADFELQGQRLEVLFDYDQDNVQGEKIKTLGVKASNAVLDYAVLELERSMVNRSVLPLWGNPLAFVGTERLPVNIIQHPAGAPKQLAIRNNLAAAMQKGDLAYFTDTDGGSSGAPVCNDSWQVIALHKAATMSLGKFNYQGKETVWVNIGTLMHRIIDDLRTNNPGLWAEIGAILV